ncbi:purine phosphorylase [Streptomyces californicus]|uniref:5'-methylthioadenosine/S-adenosylhomocysteine nucleosidase family protein n=1 Tax=Streptomyces californicus TaxID=67351 RepID=UPI0036A1AFAC
MDGTVVILTALNLEYQEVASRLTGLNLRRHPRGTLFDVGTVRGTSCRVALCLTNKGNNSAAVIAERAIQEFSPLAVVFSGVAGALWDSVRLGDVVMASHIYAYHGGTSEDDGLKARPRSWEASHEISQLGLRLARTNDWAGPADEHETPPQLVFGPIAAGEVVQNSTVSAQARWIRQHYNDALAIEMEGAGVAQACHIAGAPAAVVRGISDRADGTKSGPADHVWQPRAAANAAAFATRLAVEISNSRAQFTAGRTARAADRGTSARTTTPSERRGERTINTATGSTVGIMGGTVENSSVHVTPDREPTPTATGLDSHVDLFERHLHDQFTREALEQGTYEAALAELEHLRQDGRRGGARSSTPATEALSRLRGLLRPTPELLRRLAPLARAIGAR